MRIPTKHKVYDLMNNEFPVTTNHPDGRWIAARGETWQGGPWYRIKNRLSLAWLVFIGRYDALDWEDQ